METIPVKLIAVCSIMALVVGTGTWQVRAFMDLRSEQDFVAGLRELSGSMGVLRSAGDQGAVSSALVPVPPGCLAVLDPESDTLTGVLRERNYSLGLPANLTAVKLGGDVSRNRTVLPGGRYELRLYYGPLQDWQIQEYTVVFE